MNELIEHGTQAVVSSARASASASVVSAASASATVGPEAKLEAAAAAAGQSAADLANQEQAFGSGVDLPAVRDGAPVSSLRLIKSGRAC